MIDMFTEEDLKELMGASSGISVSIYMPTARMGRETEEGPLRLKNLLKMAEEELMEKGVRAVEAKTLLDPVRPLMSDGLFWQHQGEGLAIFLSREKAFRYRLPLEFEELATVGERFHVKPLLSLFYNDGRFFILALSKNEIRLIQCSRFSADEVDLKAAPSSLAEALRFDEEPESQLQFHIAATAPGAGGRGQAMFHGHGGVGADDAKKNLLRYFQEVDKGLKERLKRERAPLILAGVGYLLSIYREASGYPLILDETIEGSPDRLSTESLHKQAVDIVGPLFEKEQSEAIAKYEELIGSKSREATSDMKEIVIAAHEGRIDTLLVATDFQEWGLFEPDLRKVELHKQAKAESQDLLDLAAVHTLLSGGVVYAKKKEELPKGILAGAWLRY
ncbi:MAG: hypothetical protein QMD53_02925 [Actinomycetota bacterium]|nr:hypothetical protein [Actinomycetota bacterium]